MLQNLSQFSFLLALGMLAVVLVAGTWEKRRGRYVGIAAAVLLLAGWWFLRPGAGGTATAETLTSALQSGQPVVVEVYSDY
jgi:hypothetical protein